MSEQQRPRSDCVDSQYNHYLHCPLTVFGYYRMFEWRAKAQMILCACTELSESAHFVHVWRHFFARGGSFECFLGPNGRRYTSSWWDAFYEVEMESQPHRMLPGYIFFFLNPGPAEANSSGSALFVNKYVNLYQQPGLSNLIGWNLKVAMAP